VRKPIETLADRLGHPEGPDVLPDGRIVFVETYTSRIGVWEDGRGVSTYADCGGGPNACMLGSDALYITQNGGTAGPWRAERMSTPSIQKAWPDGRVEILVEEVDGVRLQAPNDLTFDRDGRLWFTDPGDYDPENRPHPTRLFVLEPDGSGRLVLEKEPAYPNGIVAEQDGSIVWVESYPRQVWRRRPDGATELVRQLDEGHVPDGLKVAANGDLWVTAFMAGGVDIVHPDGSSGGFLETGGVPLNCVFDRGSLVITDLGDVTELAEDGAGLMTGRLWRVAVDVEGMPLFRGAIGG
jgi:gluconolactonase